MLSQEILDKFVYIEGGRNLPQGKFTRNEMMKVSDVKDWRNKNGNTGLYLTAYMYDQEDQYESELFGDFYLDFDSEDDFELARQDALRAVWYLSNKYTYAIPHNMLRIYFSGKKGLHIVVPAEIMGITGDKNLNEYYKVMAQKISEQLKHDTLDKKIYDRRRLFRAPNSRHHNTLLFKIPITYYELVHHSLDQIKELAKLPRRVEYETPYEISRAKTEFLHHIVEWTNRFGQKFSDKKFDSKPLDFVPSCIQHLIDSGPMQGQRNETAAALTSFWKKQGFTEQGIWELLVKWNNESIEEWELKNTMQSILRRSYEYGCSRLEVISICAGNECPLFKKV